MSNDMGFVLRVHEKEEMHVKDRVNRVLNMVRRIRQISAGQIVVLVPTDVDCGQTVPMLQLCLKIPELQGTFSVRGVPGSQNIDVLNFGLDMLAKLGSTHAVIVSNKSIEAVTGETLSQMEMLFLKGAKAVGIAFGESAELVRKGILQNTLTGYHIQTALGVGGFDYEHDDGGVEEISLLLAIVFEYGQCLGVVESSAKAEILDTPEARARAQRLSDTKWDRVAQLLGEAGHSVDYFEQFLL